MSQLTLEQAIAPPAGDLAALASESLFQLKNDAADLLAAAKAIVEHVDRALDLKYADRAHQPQADALDTERLDWLIEQGCSHGVVYEGLDKSFWMVWLDGHDAHKDKHQISRYHTAREAIDAAKGFPAAKENK